MLSLDTVDRGYLGRHGGHPGVAPFLDRLAGEGLALDDHQAYTWWTYRGVLCTLAGHAMAPTQAG
jgi:hypothetical protein